MQIAWSLTMVRRWCINGLIGENSMERLTKLTALAVTLGLIALQANADFIVTRAFRSAINTEFERLFINEVTRNGQIVSVGASTMLNAPLLDPQRIWVVIPVRDQNQIVYGAFDPDDFGALDDLFVVDLRLPGRARQLNPARTNPATQSITGFAATGDRPRIVYTLFDSATNLQTIHLADSRNPGTSVLVAPLGDGERLGNQLVVSPDATAIAYSVEPASGAQQLRLSFLNPPANSTLVHTDATLTGFRVAEVAFSEDSRRLFWLDNGSLSEPGPLQSAAVDPIA